MSPGRAARKFRRGRVAIALIAAMALAVGCSGGSSTEDTAGDSNGGATASGPDGASSEGSAADSSAGDSGTAPSGEDPAAGGGEFSAGIPADFEGALPMPEVGQAYNNPQPRDSIQDGGTLTLPIGNFGPNFNWFSAAGSQAANDSLLGFIAPRLWQTSIGGEVTPNTDYLLSAEVTSEDPMVVEYTLNPDATWNNGDPITWKAFETMWITQSGKSEEFAPNSTGGYSSIASVEQGETPKDVIVTFETPYHPYTLLFARLQHPKNQDPEFYASGWVNDLHPELAAGPFTVDALSTTEVVLTRNPKWWGEPTKLDKIVFRQMDAAASINAFVNGEIDAVGVTTADRLEQVRGMSDITIRRGFRTFVAVFLMTEGSPFFQDEQARKAAILGTDRSLLASIALNGLDWTETPPGSQLIFPFRDGYQDNMADLGYDVEQAKAVLDDAGWAAGGDGYRSKGDVPAEFVYATFGDDPTTGALARAEQQLMKEIGVKMIIENHPQADFGTVITERKWDMISSGWTFEGPSDYAMYGCALYCTGSGNNLPGLGSDELNAKFEAVGTVEDPAESLEAFNEAESEALQLFGAIPIYNGPNMTATKAGLANYGPAGYLTVPPQDLGWQK